MFLNDVVFEARQVVELLHSRLESDVDAAAGGYDLACGMDYGWSGAFFLRFLFGMMDADFFSCRHVWYVTPSHSTPSRN